MCKLSILILTQPKRTALFDTLCEGIIKQAGPKYADDIEIRFSDIQSHTLGARRNWLVSQSQGEYICFHDDDDPLQPDYIPELLKACEQGPDAIGMRGLMTTNGMKRISFEISRDNPYTAVHRNGQEVYLRWNNHLTPIKRSIAQQFKFPDVNYGEDYQWSKAIHDSGLIKTEVFIDKFLYHYDFRTGANKL